MAAQQAPVYNWKAISVIIVLLGLVFSAGGSHQVQAQHEEEIAYWKQVSTSNHDAVIQTRADVAYIKKDNAELKVEIRDLIKLVKKTNGYHNPN